MYSNGDARRVLHFIKENYAEEIELLGLEMSIGEGPCEEIKVTKYPSMFMDFMESQGYCNRHKFNTYKPNDVLSFVIMSANRLYAFDLNDEANELLGDTIYVSSDISSDCLSYEQGKKLRNKIIPYIKRNRPVFLNFEKVKQLSPIFLSATFSPLYKEFKSSQIWTNIIPINMLNSYWDMLEDIKRNSHKYHNDTNYRKSLNSILEVAKREDEND